MKAPSYDSLVRKRCCLGAVLGEGGSHFQLIHHRSDVPASRTSRSFTESYCTGGGQHADKLKKQMTGTVLLETEGEGMASGKQIACEGFAESHCHVGAGCIWAIVRGPVTEMVLLQMHAAHVGWF